MLCLAKEVLCSFTLPSCNIFRRPEAWRRNGTKPGHNCNGTLFCVILKLFAHVPTLTSVQPSCKVSCRSISVSPGLQVEVFLRPRSCLAEMKLDWGFPGSSGPPRLHSTSSSQALLPSTSCRLTLPTQEVMAGLPGEALAQFGELQF